MIRYIISILREKMKDQLGSLCSFLCIVHCSLTPLFLIFGLSIVDIAFLENEWIHRLIAIPMVLLMLLSIPVSIKSHGKYQPFLIGGIGLLVLFWSLLAAEEIEAYLTVVAGLLLMTAHVLNRKLLLGQFA